MEYRTPATAAEMEPLGSNRPRSSSVGSSRLPRLAGCLNMDLRGSTRCVAFICAAIVVARVVGLLRESGELKHKKNGGGGGDSEELEYVSWFLLGLVALYVIQAVTIIVLFFGAKRQNKNCLCPFLMVYVVLVPMLTVIHAGMAIVLFITGEWIMGIIELVYAFIVAGLGVWFLLIVYSYYRELRREGPVEVGQEGFIDFLKKNRTVPVRAPTSQPV